jgi:hypothetical protein
MRSKPTAVENSYVVEQEVAWLQCAANGRLMGVVTVLVRGHIG